MLEIKDKQKWRYVIAVWGCLECLGFSGYIYGWGSLIYVLKEEGIYADLCPQHNATINDTQASLDQDRGVLEGCTEQDNRLSLVFAIASSAVNFGVFVMGKVSHTFGTRVTRLSCELMFALGAILMAVASPGIPWTLYPGLCLVGIGGLMFMLTSVQIANLFTKGRGVIVGLINGALDSSAGILLLVKFGYEAGISRQTSFLIIAGSSAVFLVSTLCFLPRTFIDYTDGDVIEIDVTPDSSSSDENTQANGSLANTDIKQKDAMSANDLLERKESEKRSEEGSVLKRVLSSTYLLHLFWFLLLHFRFGMFINSINPTFEKVLDTKEQVSEYTNLLMYLLMCGLPLSIVAGFVFSLCCHWFRNRPEAIQRHILPTILPLSLTSLFSIIVSALVLLETPVMFYPAFVFLLLYRSFLYTMTSAYIANAFPSSFFAILMGILYLCGGVINLLQYAITLWTDARGFQEVNVFLLVLVAITLIHPLYQWLVCKRSSGAIPQVQPTKT